MKIALIGYGKMGKEIEQIALGRDHQISLKITSANLQDLTMENLKTCDVAIDFSLPSTAVQNIKLCIEAGTPVVVGTTGWYDSFDDIKSFCKERNGAIFYATNFSVGVNIFFKINSLLAKIMNGQKGYNVDMEEIHHTQKLDHPSGTAITLAEKILDQLDHKTDWKGTLEDEQAQIKNDQLHIKALRQHNVPGTHTVNYRSEEDTLSLTHTAHSRKGFALGAVLAAEFINNKQGIFNMEDLLKF